MVSNAHAVNMFVHKASEETAHDMPIESMHELWMQLF